MAKKLSIGSPLQIADKLFKIRTEIEAYKEYLKPLEDKEDKLRVEMVESLKANRMNSLETDKGITYTHASRAKLIVVDKSKAQVWAAEHDCLKIDIVMAGKFLKGRGALPDGFTEEFTDYLQVTGIKDALLN